MSMGSGESRDVEESLLPDRKEPEDVLTSSFAGSETMHSAKPSDGHSGGSVIGSHSLRLIFEEGKYHRLTVENLNVVDKIKIYLRSDFTFALLYWGTSKHCLSNADSYLHALWFSVQTAATIGYGNIAPNPKCTFLNFSVMIEVLCALLMQASLLGLVFARFSAPGARASAIRFSSILACFRGDDGMRRLAFRVANVRKHQVLQPEVRMLLIHKEKLSNGNQEYRYHELALNHISGGHRLWLGVPSIVSHTIDPSSPLWGVSRAQLEQNTDEIEFVVLLDGIDETTSTVLQARHSYSPANIQWNREFAGVLQRSQQTGSLGADFSCFDLTRLAAEDQSGKNEEKSTLVDQYPNNNEISANEVTSLFERKKSQPLLYNPNSRWISTASSSGKKVHFET